MLRRHRLGLCRVYGRAPEGGMRLYAKSKTACVRRRCVQGNIGGVGTRASGTGYVWGVVWIQRRRLAKEVLKVLRGLVV